MDGYTRQCRAYLILALALLAGSDCIGQTVRVIERAPDPHGSPRPARDARDVPLRTSVYFELGLPPEAKGGAVDADSVAVSLQSETGERVELLQPGRRFGKGVSGWLRPSGKSLAVYIEPTGGPGLKPMTRYTIRVRAGPAGGARRREDAGSWSFVTEAAPAVHSLEFRLDLGAPLVQWHGQFFCGICNVIFCTQAANYGPTYDLMAKARKQHPRAWSLQRDFWLTGTDYRPPPAFTFPSNLPNIVRERETRRIAAMESREGKVVLHVEDFFGHEQYGIPAGRPVSEDYHPGDEVLIADGVNNARTKIIAADGAGGTVTVASVATPPGGWKIAYEGPLPDREDPDAPGLFPPGGCYLRKYDPVGTACYYWGRLDKEWDLAVRHSGRRVVPNFADAPGDLSRDGKGWTTVKDYAQWHDVARAIAGHIIDRYGKDALGFTWSIFNEPDLWILFWHGTWDELQMYYDYTTDAILRAFEDRGYDSSKVFIGGLELGAAFGTNLKLREFLAHCSPRAQAEGAAPRNFAFADRRLEGKRSRRVEELCRAHGGKGAPCDFISIHSYNRSEIVAAKLIRAKEMALEIDPDYYKSLWVDSHEACPDWMPPPDEAAADAYLGDGYFPTWCLDVVHRQLTQAARDPRYAYGQTILTVWPPPTNFAGMNALTRIVHYDGGVDRTDQTVTIPMPVFHALGLLSDMGDGYWVLPDRTVGAHVVSGFASRDDRGVIRALLYSHDAQDTQARSDISFDIALDFDRLGWAGPARVREYRFDRDHNSPFRSIHALLKAVPGERPDPARLAPEVYPRAAIEQIRESSECRATATTTIPRQADGHLRLTVRIAGNGCNFLVIAPDQHEENRSQPGRS